MLKGLKEKIVQTNEKEYSKIWINKWQLFVMFWCSIFFIADIVLNGAGHSVELCTTLVVSIAAVFVPYLAKSYFGKRNEEELKMIKEGYLEYSNEKETFDVDSEES